MKLHWDEKGVPTSPEFDDVYFSPIDGLRETEYVFLEKNNLPQRFKEAQNTFTIIETGFGTGLNFLATWRLWENTAPKETKLHFISTELFPLSKEDIQKAHQNWPELKEFSQKFLRKYPNTIEGDITLHISENIHVTIYVGDIQKRITEIEECADAFFLDGFTPSKNPDMWNENLYKNMARLSKKGTTLATFTAASHVRNGLTDQGFHIERTKGFAYKKHMTIGRFNSN